MESGKEMLPKEDKPNRVTCGVVRDDDKTETGGKEKCRRTK